jgi:hypothetical protein
VDFRRRGFYHFGQGVALRASCSNSSHRLRRARWVRRRISRLERTDRSVAGHTFARSGGRAAGPRRSTGRGALPHSRDRLRQRQRRAVRDPAVRDPQDRRCHLAVLHRRRTERQVPRHPRQRVRQRGRRRHRHHQPRGPAARRHRGADDRCRHGRAAHAERGAARRVERDQGRDLGLRDHVPGGRRRLHRPWPPIACCSRAPIAC